MYVYVCIYIYIYICILGQGTPNCNFQFQQTIQQTTFICKPTTFVIKQLHLQFQLLSRGAMFKQIIRPQASQSFCFCNSNILSLDQANTSILKYSIGC